MFTNTLFRSSLVRFGLLGMLVCLSMIVGVWLTGQAKAAPPQSTAIMNVASAPAETGVNTVRRECQVTHVFEFVHVDQSVLITCATPVEEKISSFSQPLSDPLRASHMMAMALTAIATGKMLLIDYEPANTDVVGCSPENCRNIFELGIKN